MAASVILIEDGLQIVSQIILAIQQAHANGSGTIDASVLVANREARNAALKKFDDDIAASD